MIDLSVKRSRRFDRGMFSRTLAIAGLWFAIFFGNASVGFSRDTEDQQCRDIVKRLELLEGKKEPKAGEEVRSAPQIRKEIAERQQELERLQSLQKGGQAIYLSTVINHVPMVAVAVVGSLTGISPESATAIVNGTGNLQTYVNQREIRIRQTELPRLEVEQIDVGRRIFLLREESESLGCTDESGGGQADLMERIVGKWRAHETGTVLEISSEGVGVLRDVGVSLIPFGFSPGETALTEIRLGEDDTLEARLMLRPLKVDCPELKPLPVGATIRFQPGRRSFVLTAPIFAYCTQPCQWTGEEKEPLTRTFDRVE